MNIPISYMSQMKTLFPVKLPPLIWSQFISEIIKYRFKCKDNTIWQGWAG